MYWSPALSGVVIGGVLTAATNVGGKVLDVPARGGAVRGASEGLSGTAVPPAYRR
jgi:hypothetical protein